MNTYPIGTKVYYDTFSGLIPGILTAIHETEVSVKLTANRGAYRKGETILASRHMTVPRNHVFRRCGQFRIRTNYAYA